MVDHSMDGESYQYLVTDEIDGKHQSWQEGNHEGGYESLVDRLVGSPRGSTQPS